MGTERVKWNDVTAIFGGTFDPPHLGHRLAVSGLFEQPGVGRVIVVPSGTPALKQARTATSQRWEMTQIAFRPSAVPPLGGPVEISDLEIKRASLRPSEPSYTYDTLMELRSSFPKLAFVIGADQLETLERWHRFPELLGLCHWIVLKRRGLDSTDGTIPLARWHDGGLIESDSTRLGSQDQWVIRGSKTVLIRVETPAPAISSSLVRETIQKTGSPPEDALDPEVIQYLNNNRLYGTQRPLHEKE